MIEKGEEIIGDALMGRGREISEKKKRGE